MTGRHLSLAKAGIVELDLRVPDLLACDVGTSLHVRTGEGLEMSEVDEVFVALHPELAKQKPAHVTDQNHQNRNDEQHHAPSHPYDALASRLHRLGSILKLV